MFKLREREKGQSAIEYLMTYGWAILIIGIVLAVLFKLNVFSTSSLVGITCTGDPGFLCSNPVLNSTGQLAFSMGQVSSSTYFNVEVACSAAFNTSGLPSNSMSWTLIQANGRGIPVSQLAGRSESVTNGTVLLSTQTFNARTVPCYDSTGMPLSNPTAVGTTFSGSLWINYTLSSCTPGSPGCTPAIVKFATVTARVV